MNLDKGYHQNSYSFFFFLKIYLFQRGREGEQASSGGRAAGEGKRVPDRLLAKPRA